MHKLSAYSLCTMLLVVALAAIAAAAPATYDRRQDGAFNVDATVQNVLFLVALPKKMPFDIFDIFDKSNSKNIDKEPQLQDRSDIRVMEAFVEPSTPYRVEIGSDRASDGDGRAVEVVIAGRRRSDIDAQDDEMKLIGATENCGPDRVRDSTTLMCKDKTPEKIDAEAEPEPSKEKESKVEIKPTPEVIST